MASYDAEESSLENSQPYEVYRFLLGSTEYLFTSAEDEVIVDGKTYAPSEIKRSVIGLGKGERTKVLTVSVAINNSLAQRYVGPPPGERAVLTIFRVQRDDGSASPALIYSGSIKTVSYPKNGQFAEILVQTIEAQTNRQVPRFTYMGMCNHLLYDANCGIVQSSHQHLGAVTLVDNNEITIAGLSASGLGVLGGFMISASGIEKRTILAVTGDVVTVLLPMETDPTGTTISIFAGCNRVLTQDCAVVYLNEINFGGFAFVPNRNVFTAGL